MSDTTSNISDAVLAYTARQAYTEFLAKHQLEIKLDYLGFKVKRDRIFGGAKAKPWPCFHWRYVVTRTGREAALMEGDYYTGIGHSRFESERWREQAEVYCHTNDKLYLKLHRGRSIYPESKFAMKSKKPGEIALFFDSPNAPYLPVKLLITQPAPADILDSLRNDAQCAAPTFEDFCAELGYDEDSRSAHDVYLACCEIERKLRGILGLQGMWELIELERL